MHTLMIIAIGVALLGVCAVCGYWLNGASGAAAGAMIFLPLWFVGCAINLGFGVKRAGYSVAEEIPIFLIVFAIPAVIALIAWWKFR